MTSRDDLVGRRAESARLVDALAAAAGGRPSTVLLSGEAGVGKTALLRAFADGAEASGARVLTGACVDLSSGDLPYVPVVEALRSLVRDAGEQDVRRLAGPGWSSLARMAPFLGEPEEGTAGGADARVHMFEAILELLRRLGQERPVVLICEDLHWADRSTLDLLAFLVRMITDERLLLLITYRSNDLEPRHPLRPLIVEFERSRRVDHLRLRPFDHDESVQFVIGRSVGSLTPVQLERTISLAEGNAFFLEEMVVSGAAATEPGDRLPASLSDMVLTRVEPLSAEAQEVLRAAAAAGRYVGHRLLATACDLPERSLLTALRECTTRQLLTEGPQPYSYAFRHALVREAVYGDLLPGERMRLHAAIATALSGEQAAAGELAHHWFQAGDRERAFTTSLRAAAEAATACAFAESDRLYERALQLWGEVGDPEALGGAAHAEVLRRAADAARWAGDLARALSRAGAALDEEADPAGRAALLERLGRYRWETGDSEGTLRAYAEADALLADGPPSPLRARVHADLATTHLRNGRYALGRRLGAEAVAMARAVDAVAEEGQALNPLGIGLTMTGDPDGGVAAIRRAVEIARAGGHLDDLHRAYVNLTFVLANVGRRADALEVAQHGIVHVRRLGLEWTAGGVLVSNAATLQAELGRWDEAERTAVEALDHDLPTRSTLYLRLLLAGLEIARGRFDRAEHLIGSAQETMRRLDESEYSTDIHTCLAEIAIWRRDHHGARRAVADGLRAVQDSEDQLQQLRLYGLGLRAEADEAQRLAALGRDVSAVREAAGDLAARAAKLAPDGGAGPLLPDVPLLARLCQAERLRAEGADDPGEWAWIAEGWEGLDRPYPAAYGHWRRADALLATAVPDRAAAAGALRAGHRIASGLGAFCLLRELDALAQRARIDPGGPDDGPAAGGSEPIPFRLTRRELQVLQELGKGSSNRQIARQLFIAEKTASVHVSNILTKLGVASRGEAAAMAYRAGLVPRDG
ncbi:helix-turn-helix transcriptional regulator [Paractinoplanes atraurantiacus]|uniref:Predicted ATPase n=1 Tax=Paractinoplanes atraurantiacus TaxID=1036182 RepID=A0A285HTY9_9ACTN|nr:AAA family ATPase [Actinoplanes atraurantiacus]SNY39093.1 Predicted ATPase [Actinoplanes atraurantiacus]